MHAFLEIEPDTYAPVSKVLADEDLKANATAMIREKLQALASAVQEQVLDLAGLGRSAQAEYEHFVKLLTQPPPASAIFQVTIDPKED